MNFSLWRQHLFNFHLECPVPKEALHVAGSCIGIVYSDDGYPLRNLDPARVLHKLDEVFAVAVIVAPDVGKGSVGVKKFCACRH